MRIHEYELPEAVQLAETYDPHDNITFAYIVDGQSEHVVLCRSRLDALEMFKDGFPNAFSMIMKSIRNEDPPIT